jgi:hypothetical protein
MTPDDTSLLDTLDRLARELERAREQRKAHPTSGRARDREHDAEWRWSQACTPERITRLVALARQGAAYDEIFLWLLGEAGDFPESAPGRRYGFRTELRARLNAARALPDGGPTNG